MKNKFLMALALLAMLSFTYCGSQKSESEEAATETEEVEPAAEEAVEEEADDMEDEGSEEGEVESDTTAAE